MRRKIYLCLIVAILFEAIIAFSEDNQGSSNLLVRKRRIIDLTPYRTSVTIRNIPYIVNIKIRNTSQCGGSILSPNIIITAAHCVFGTGDTLNVISGSTQRHTGVRHEVKHLQIHPNFNRSHFADDLALLYIRPAIDLVRSANRKIEFYNGPLRSGVIGTISGWGCTNLPGKRLELEYPENLQATEVPLVNLQECREAYERIETSAEEKYLCASHNEGQNGACRGDDGGPFVVNGKLAGVLFAYSLSKEAPVKSNPDYYVNLAYPPFRHWIVNTMEHLEHFGGLRKIY